MPLGQKFYPIKKKTKIMCVKTCSRLSSQQEKYLVVTRQICGVALSSTTNNVCHDFLSCHITVRNKVTYRVFKETRHKQKLTRHIEHFMKKIVKSYMKHYIVARQTLKNIKNLLLSSRGMT